MLTSREKPMMKRALLSLIFSFLWLTSTLAADKGAAKAIIVKGTVKALIDGKTVPVKRGMWLPEGAQVKTEPKSFTKLLFIDKSTMNVGPDSQMKIDSFPKKEAGIITLVKGQVRSKVTKNYMDMKDKDKSKLFIKTKTAAMGVRGTDFQVSFNPVNLATSLVTFEGAVAMAKLAESMANGRPVQRALEAVVSGKGAVMVRRGQYSGSSPKMKAATIPVKISPVQLETLEKNETPGVAADPDQASSSDNAPKKKFRNVVPPGMDSKIVANDTSAAEAAIADTVGSGAVKAVETEIKAEMAAIDQNAPPPEGMVDPTTGAIAPTAGGFIDLATAQYVPPPEGSTFDANAGVYVPPPELGGVDPATGTFTNDHYTLNPDGSFTEKVAPEMNNEAGPAAGADGGRKIASVDGGGDTGAPKTAEAPPPPPEVKLISMDANIDSALMESSFVAGAGPGGPNAAGPDGNAPLPEPDATLLDAAEQTLQQNEQQILDFNNSDNNLIFTESGRTKVNFEIDVQP